MSLRKGDTFHTPPTTKANELWDPLESRAQSPSMPGRSTTCPKSLEDLLIGAGERRAADLLARVDQAIATQSKLALGAVLNEPEVLPVPSFVLDQISIDEDAAAYKTPSRTHRYSHSSDSGIGSSVAGSTDLADAKPSSTGEQSSCMILRRALTLLQITPWLPPAISHFLEYPQQARSVA